jgi:hypothetical protein
VVGFTAGAQLMARQITLFTLTGPMEINETTSLETTLIAGEIKQSVVVAAIITRFDRFNRLMTPLLAQ